MVERVEGEGQGGRERREKNPEAEGGESGVGAGVSRKSAPHPCAKCALKPAVCSFQPQSHTCNFVTFQYLHTLLKAGA